MLLCILCKVFCIFCGHSHDGSCLQFIGACKDPLMVIVSELLPGMSLRKYLVSIRPKVLDLRLVLNYALDIARALECLHVNNIIHRDLKPGITWLVELYKNFFLLLL